jgi:hypothetical protein
MSAPYDMQDQIERTHELFRAVLGPLRPFIAEARDQNRNPIDTAEIAANAMGNALGMIIGSLPAPAREQAMSQFLAGFPNYVAVWAGDAPKGGIQ